MTVYVRAAMPAEQVVSMARDRVRRIDANMPLYGVRTIEDRLSDSLLIERLTAGLAAGFGVLAALLACVGLYGVMAYNVARRTREIGLRMALGAFGGDVVWLVLREALIVLALGMAVGLPVALGLARYAQSQLFGVHFADPLTLALAVASLSLAATLAGFIPARRASRVDPLFALRYE